MAEITVLGAVKAPSTPSIEARRDLFLSLFGPRARLFVKMWPSNEFEFETPGLLHKFSPL
jgi:hypothetical protein